MVEMGPFTTTAWIRPRTSFLSSSSQPLFQHPPKVVEVEDAEGVVVTPSSPSSSLSSSRTLEPRSSVPSTRQRQLPADGLSLQDFLVHKQRSPSPGHSSHEQQQQQQQQQQPTDVIINHSNSRNSSTAEMASSSSPISTSLSPSLSLPLLSFHLKTFGCQMNVNDSDIVRSLLLQAGLMETSQPDEAHILLTNTCAIRENAETKIWHRLREIQGRYHPQQQQQTAKKNKIKNKKIVGVLGCMAERLQKDLLQDGLADLVVGPDEYRELAPLIQRLWQHYHPPPPLSPSSPALPESGTDQPRSTQDHNDMVVSGGDYHQGPTLAEEEDPSDWAVRVQLSLEETYADITPVRATPAVDSHSSTTNQGSDPMVSAFVSIQRGCSNRCSFCIVPLTRGGRERSRPWTSIVDEITQLHQQQGLREVTLLGQNVNSYLDTSGGRPSHSASVDILMHTTSMPSSEPENDHVHDSNIDGDDDDNEYYPLSNDGFRSRVRRRRQLDGCTFSDLLAIVSDISPELRVRFTSPHPKDYPPALLQLMAERPNICQHVHMPAQSGSDTVLRRMKRGYTRQAYLQLLEEVRSAIPDIAISSDFIAGFCDETEEEHQETLSLMETVRFDQAYMFAYSMRAKTPAHRTMTDNVPEEIKQRRLRKIIDTFHRHVHAKNSELEVGRFRLVLAEGPSKRSLPPGPGSTGGLVQWHGRTDQNKRILFTLNDQLSCYTSGILTLPAQAFQADHKTSGATTGVPRIIPPSQSSTTTLRVGDYAVVYVTEAKGHTLRGQLICPTTLSEFHRLQQCTDLWWSMPPTHSQPGDDLPPSSLILPSLLSSLSL